MRIDIVFDTVCPWCYVGKRRLERALKDRGGLKADLRWRPFLLNPDMPPSGIERRAYLERKFGSGSRIQQIFGAVVTAGQGEGIPFAFDRIARTPDAVPSHRLVRHLSRFGQGSEAVEAVFKAYFVDGRDIGDIDLLAAMAGEMGFDEAEILAYLESEEDVADIYSENARAHRQGINGVPSYLFDETFALSGAQESDVFLRLIDLARESETAFPVS
jgi:predicted DsbA family dithiol-disulfide isomerase